MTGKAFRTAYTFAFIRHTGFISIKLLTLFFILTLSALIVQAQKKDIETSVAFGSPDVKITRVTNRGVVGDDATLVIRVEWSAQAPQISTLLGFNASVEVEYADGSKNSNSQSVTASARQADLRILNKGANSLRRFTARLRTDFKFLDTSFINRTEEFDLGKANGFDASSASDTRPAPEAFAISRVRAKFDGCSPAKNCFIIDWGVTPRPSVQLVEVSLQASVTYLPGNQTRSGAATAQATARTATLTVDDPKGKFESIKVRLTSKVSATISTHKNTQLTGSF